MCRVEVAKALLYTRADTLRGFTIDINTLRVSGWGRTRHTTLLQKHRKSKPVGGESARVRACVEKFCNLSFHDLECFFSFLQLCDG
jgi:hypothetical protein